MTNRKASDGAGGDPAVMPPGPGRTPELVTLPWARAALNYAGTFRRASRPDAMVTGVASP